MTSDFCLPVASSLVLHPKSWRSVFTWSRQPRGGGLGNHDPSLHLLHLNEAKVHFGPEVMAPEILERLEEVEAKYEDWQHGKSPDTMLGVLTMAAASGGGASSVGAGRVRKE